MNYISCVTTALPSNSYSLEEIKASTNKWLENDLQAQKLCNKFLDSAKTNKRHFVIPPNEVINVSTISQKSNLFHKHGIEIGSRALQAAVKNLDSNHNIKIDSLVFTSCSFPSIPAIDTEIIQHVGLPASTFRVPIFQYGCVGGVAGLSLANKLASGFNATALLSVELCSLVFQPNNHEPSQLVGTAIFGDGSACVVLNKDSGIFRVINSSSYLIPESPHIMGYDFKDDGWHLRLDKELPNLLNNTIKPLVKNFLEANSTAQSEVDWWLFHPGSMKILTELKQIFELNSSNSGFAENFLSEHGNLSSASILFILKEFIDSKCYSSKQRVLVMGIGPGLTVELVLLECV